MEFRIRFASSARRHRVGVARILEAMHSAHTIDTLDEGHRDPAIRWIGVDGRGIELEVIAVVQAGQFLIIHAMPTHYRR